MAQQSKHSYTPRSPDIVARVNMVPEDGTEADGRPQTAAASTVEGTIQTETPPARAPLLQVVPLGLLAVIVIAISMYLILQGVFEMIPD